MKILLQSRGGLLIECERSLGLALNHWLKIPTRIILRLDEFRCRDFPKLFNRVRKLPWHDYLRQGEIGVMVSVHESRIKIKERLEKCVKDALQDNQKHQPFRKKFLNVPQTIFLRVKRDIVTISIDTSGSPLFKRGYKRHSVQAPLRETLAAALVTPLLMSEPRGRLIDMMAGSGTLGFEALSYYYPIRGRNFSYQNFPKVTTFESSKKPLSNLDFEGHAYEVDSNSFEALNRNADEFKTNFSLSLTCHRENIFEAPLQGPVHLLCNPPYNERLLREENLLSRIQDLLKTTSAKSLSLIWPGTVGPEMPFPWTRSLATENGGIAVTFNFWRQKE